MSLIVSDFSSVLFRKALEFSDFFSEVNFTDNCVEILLNYPLKGPLKRFPNIFWGNIINITEKQLFNIDNKKEIID